MERDGRYGQMSCRILKLHSTCPPILSLLIGAGIALRVVTTTLCLQVERIHGFNVQQAAYMTENVFVTWVQTEICHITQLSLAKTIMCDHGSRMS